ncbi:hypothetical protein DFJ74DRAFT_130077 [Hyaloraphidium curvatum]|nr:hypothetical protein DFJ74DRAFT_130077 [Hyaloraphidium curvatum]
MNLQPADLRSAVARQDGDLVAAFFDPLPRIAADRTGARRGATAVPSTQWEDAVPDYFKGTMRNHWRLVNDTDFADAVAVHEGIARVYEAFVGGVFGSNYFAAWHVATLKVLARSLASTAWKADAALVRARQRPSKAKNLSQFFQNTFRIINSPSGQLSRRVVLLWISNLMLQQYLRLGALKLCEGLIASLKSMKMDLSEYSSSEHVAFRYWLGRMRVIQNHFRPAAANLEDALRRCPRGRIRARRKIFFYLALSRLVLGQPPPASLVAKYGFGDHLGEGMVGAWKRGNFSAFKAEVDRDAGFWLRKGCYYVVTERTKMGMFRNLLRNVIAIIRSEGGGSQMISLASCLAACHAAGLSDFTVDDIEDTVVSLIELGMVRGYLHHERGVLVIKSGAPLEAVLPDPIRPGLASSEMDIPL